MKTLTSILLILIIFASCSKEHIDPAVTNDSTSQDIIDARSNTTQYVKYTIRKGQHYCDQSTFKLVKTSKMNFIAKFDNSAIYQTINPDNQYDINKLYGFSEGWNHEYNSARIGWAWNDGALRLYAYAYNNGVRESKEITRVAIGVDINCSIAVSGYNYVFTVNGTVVTLARAASTLVASGYQLYPYFGGDEVAPHDINILIRDL